MALLGLPALFALPAAGAAQGGDSPRGRHAEGRHGFHARMAEYLELSDQQQASARELFADLREKTRPLREEQRATREQLRTALDAPNPDPTAIGRLVLSIHAKGEEMRAARKQADASFAALLTPEQRQKFDALKDGREVFGRGGRGRHWHRGERGGRR